MTDFSGRWLSTFGNMELTQSGSSVEGTYGDGNTLAGDVVGNRLTFRYQEPTVEGDGWFDLVRHGKFVGQWREDAGDRWLHWSGERAFEGIWDSSFGPLRLIQEPERVFGFYEGGGRSTIEGRMEGSRMVFHYHEPNVEGEGWFELADDWRTFHGQWRPTGAAAWGTWLGERLRPRPRFQWLIIIEAHWQRFLTDPEYSFGFMLREFFARLPGVGVRHRFFNDEASLEHWCRELLYVPEPAVVLFATHGSQEGLSCHGRTIQPDNLAGILPFADSVKLLHFSACLMMQGEDENNLPRKLHQLCSFPISGYTTSVDWSGSALLEFTYLDMMLSKGLSPEDAADQLLRQIGFAGDTAPEDSPYAPAGFRLLSNARTLSV